MEGVVVVEEQEGERAHAVLAFSMSDGAERSRIPLG